MANIGYEYKVGDVEPRKDFTALPHGDYVAMVVNSEMRPTKSGKGEYLSIEIDIVEGEHKGRKIFEILNLKNDNETAVKIAFQTLDEICRAVARQSIKDSTELHNRLFVMTLGVKDEKKVNGIVTKCEPYNYVKKYSPYSAGGLKNAESPAKTAPKKPWEN